MSTVLVERAAPGVDVVTLHRPDSLNAMSHELVDELHAVFDAVAADASCRAVVLTGAGRGFCSGHDIAELREGRDETVPRVLQVQQAFARLTPRLRSLPQPVIAAVNGPAVGGGLGLALAADTRVCSASASFCAAFVRVGLSGCDVGVSYLLPRIVGATAAFEMMLTGRSVGAEEAARIALVLEVVPDGEVVEAAVAIAATIAGNSPFGVLMTKEVMWANLEAPTLDAAIALENRTQALCFATTDHREAVASFLERRAPTFTGR